MKKLRGILYSICIMFMYMITTPAMSGPIEFTGIFGALKKSTTSVQFQGSYSNEQENFKRGTGGKTYSLPGVEFGINIPIGQTLHLGIGGVKSFGKTELTELLKADNFSDLILTLIDRKSWDVKPSVNILGNIISYSNDVVKIRNKFGVTLETSTNKEYGNISIGYKF